MLTCITEDEEHKDLLARIDGQINEAARLKEENERLNELLKNQDSDTAVCAEPQKANATNSTTEFQRLNEKYNELNKRYHSSAQKVKYLERKNVTVMQKNKEMKESVRAWQEYSDRNINKQRIKTEGKTVNDRADGSAVPNAPDFRLNLLSSPKSSALRTPRSLVAHERSSPVPSAPLTSPPLPASVLEVSDTGERQQTDDSLDEEIPLQRSDEDCSPFPEDHGRIARSAVGIPDGACLGQSGSERITSSQTTEDEIAERNNTNFQTSAEDEDDDVPEFVSARSLKRKRKPSAGIKIYTDRSDGTPAKPIRVKEEPRSSPPLPEVLQNLQRKETMDLDELGNNAINTPRKRSRRTKIDHPLMSEVLKDQGKGTGPFDKMTIKRESHTQSAGMANPELDDVRPTETTDSRTKIKSEHAEVDLVNALQPVDSNAPLRYDEGARKKRIVNHKDRQAEKHGMIAESGETPPPVDENRKRLTPRQARAQYNHKVRALKDITTPFKNAATTTPKTAPAKVATATHPPIASSPSANNREPNATHSAPVAQRKLQASKERFDTRPELVPDGRPIWTLGPLAGSSKKPTHPPHATPDKSKPLRSKHMDELGILDFKPNPAYNQGYTHAFSETVRKRSDRLCLPGCTSPECCGSTFRALARAAGPLSSSQEEDLLQEYLGDAYDSFGLTQMSQGERDEVVLQARTRQMANEHGKHRQAYQRGRSPPGFWRTGFPSTQEAEADKAKDREMEKLMVRERWLEAQRKGGKWIFRDE